MPIQVRMLARVFSGGLLTLAVLAGTGEGLCQTPPPINPLRQPPGIAERIVADVPKSSEKKAESPPVKLNPPRDDAAVRQAAYAAPSRLRHASRNAVPSEPTFGTSILAEPSPELKITAPAQPKPVVTAEPVEGDVIYDGMFEAMPGEPVLGPMDSAACCDGTGCANCCLIPCPTLSLENTEFFLGVQGFTGPMNRGQTGSFGFHEGFNKGFPFPCTAGAFGGQIGLRATQSNLSDAEFTDSIRRQLFLTGGIFRRVDWGLQGGLVVDHLSQEWYSNIDLVQLRGEVSWVFPCTHELGFWFTTGTQDQTQESHVTAAANGLLESWEPTHLYAFFYRHRVAALPGAEARGYAGFSNDSDGLIGADVHLPFGTNWGLETGFTYLAPQEAAGTAGRGHAHESWNVAISLVWYPGCRDLCGSNYFRPLFGVADNGNFMVSEQ